MDSPTEILYRADLLLKVNFFKTEKSYSNKLAKQHLHHRGLVQEIVSTASKQQLSALSLRKHEKIRMLSFFAIILPFFIAYLVTEDFKHYISDFRIGFLLAIAILLNYIN